MSSENQFALEDEAFSATVTQWLAAEEVSITYRRNKGKVFNRWTATAHAGPIFIGQTSGLRKSAVTKNISDMVVGYYNLLVNIQ